ncbi:MAG: flippase activity-associated protein Agl23, partial [Chloroflexota bacterium]
MSQSFPVETNNSNDYLNRPILALSQIDWEKVAYVVIILLAIVSRFWGLGDRVVSHDESLHTHYSFQYFNGDGYAHTPLMHGPFLFHITSFSYWLFGASDFSARIPVALFGIILVVFPYFLRPWIGKIGAIFASIILLVSPYSLYYARYIRHDVYVIVWALIVFAATWYYFKNRDDRSLYWFAFGLAMMFATKEVAFIYVAIFGSYLIIRLLAQIITEPWFYETFTKFSLPALVVIVGLLIAAVGGGMELFLPEANGLVSESITQPADPSADISAIGEGISSTTGRWLIILGLIALSFGLFLVAANLRENLIQFPEFDLIIMYTTLVLPMMVALLVVLTGRNPLEYTLTACSVPNEGALNAFQVLTAKMTSSVCWQGWFSSTIVTTMSFMSIILAVTIYVGTWWDSRRWVISAIVFHVAFALLYTSVFSNPQGWLTGSVGSLGYWLEQQEVARGGQPWFYYAVVVPFYEFLPVVFSVIAIRYWTKTVGIFNGARYWTWVIAAAVLIGSLINWYTAQSAELTGTEPSGLGGYIFGATLFLVALGIRIWTKQTVFQSKTSGANKNWVEDYLGFFPFLIWWLLLTIVAYSYAGEKMPWLSIHFVIPMAFLIGWYFNQLFREFDAATLFERTHLIWGGLALLFVVVMALLIPPLWLGQVRFGDQSQSALSNLSQFIGRVVTAGIVGYFLYTYRDRVSATIRRVYWVLAMFLFLGLLTVRFAFLASFPNADYTTEFMV